MVMIMEKIYWPSTWRKSIKAQLGLAFKKLFMKNESCLGFKVMPLTGELK
jgi:hypothetical protein